MPPVRETDLAVLSAADVEATDWLRLVEAADVNGKPRSRRLTVADALAALAAVAPADDLTVLAALLAPHLPGAAPPVIDVRAHGATLDGVTDDGPALLAAINTAKATGGGTVIIPQDGTLLLDSLVDTNFSGSGVGAVRLENHGTVHVGPMSGQGLIFANLDQAEVIGGTWQGTPGQPNDAIITLDFAFCKQAVVRGVTFAGLMANLALGAVVRAHSSDLTLVDCGFRGCAGSPSSQNSTPVVRLLNWTGFRARNCHFIDFGNYGSKTPLGATLAWISLGAVSGASDALNQAGVEIADCRFDEGAQHLILVDPTAGANRVKSVAIRRCNATGQTPTGFVGFRLKSCDYVEISDTHLGFSSNADLYAVHCTDCTVVVLDRLRLVAAGMKKVKVDGAAKLLVIRGGQVDPADVEATCPVLYIPEGHPEPLAPVTTTQRDAIASPQAGAVVWNATTLSAEVYTGTRWQAVGGVTARVGAARAADTLLAQVMGGRTALGEVSVWEVTSDGNLTHRDYGGTVRLAFSPTVERYTMTAELLMARRLFMQAQPIVPGQLADGAAAATNGTLYYSTTAGKLVFKDLSGVVNELY